MPRIKTIQEREIESTIRKSLDELGRLVVVESGRKSKVSDLQKDHLRDSGNFKTKPYNVLTVTQNFYGRYNTPKGKPTPQNRSNIKDTPMSNAVRENAKDTVKIIIKNMVDLLKSPVTLKK